MPLYLTQPDSAWLHILELAHQRNTQVRQLWQGAISDDAQDWLASSYSRPGHWHAVSIQSGPNGVRFACECERHQVGNGPCTHVARVLEAIGFLSLPDPEPTPDPSPELTRLKGQRSIAMLNGDCDEEDRLIDEIIALEGGR